MLCAYKESRYLARMKRNREKTSHWWQHFVEVAGKNHLAKCSLCKEEVSSSSTTNFARHYSVYHPVVYQRIQKEQDDLNKVSHPTRVIQTTINSKSGKLSQIPPLTLQAQKEIDHLVANMIINDGMPFKTVERTGIY